MWISVNDRVPDNRREVICFGTQGFIREIPVLHGPSRYNRSGNGGCFDCEKNAVSMLSWPICNKVTHWCEYEDILPEEYKTKKSGVQ